MSKLLYFALFVALLALLACSSPEETSSPTAVAQAPAPAPVTAATTAPVEAPVPTTAPTEIPATATSIPAPTDTPSPTAMPAPTDAPSAPTPESEMTDPTAMNDPEAFMSQLSSDEQACISEAGGAEQFMMVMDNPDLASPQERDELVNCLEHENLLKIFLKGFTDQTGSLGDDTSACVSAGFRDFDLRAMMLTNPAAGGEEAAMVQGMAGFLITLSCLNEEEWQAASPALDLQPDGRESLQCLTTMLGGPEGIAASLKSKGGEPPMAFFNAAAECGVAMMGGPPN